MKYLIPLALVLLSLAVFSAAVSPRFDARGYNLLTDSAVNRQYFSNWARYHGRSYASHEFGFRYNAWRDNYAYIEHFNANANASFTLAMNDLGDLTEAEVSRIYTGLVGTPSTVDRRDFEEAEEAAKREIEERGVPSSFDWRTQNAVTPVRSQGSCGACYAFSSIAAIEGAVQIATGSLPTLSEQMILDCAQGTGNIGCSGGNMEITYMWLLNNNGGGVSTQGSYPYSGVQGSCKMSSTTRGATFKSYRSVASGSETDLLAKAAMGPVSVGINAGPRSFAYYSGGVLDDPTCTASLNHAVTLVGWGSSGGQDYWLVKNSWGISWGQSGYAMIARNKNNMCGIASMASLPCYNADCSVPGPVAPSPSASPAAPSPSNSPAARASPSNTPAARASPSNSPAARASPSSSPASSTCKCPCACK